MSCADLAKDKKDLEKQLVEEARGCQWLVLWLDCDREGENIAYEVIEVGVSGTACAGAGPSRTTGSSVTVARAVIDRGGGDEPRGDPTQSPARDSVESERPSAVAGGEEGGDGGDGRL